MSFMISSCIICCALDLNRQRSTGWQNSPLQENMMMIPSLKWLKTFYRRFFSQQFKRSCLPDGPKVGTVAVSPRGDLADAKRCLCEGMA